MILVFLMFCPQSYSLVDLLFGETFTVQCSTILLFCLLVHLFGQIFKTARLTVLVHYLFSQHVYFFFVLLVLGLGLIQTQLLDFARMFLPIKPNIISLVIDRFRSNLRDIFFPLGKFVFDLFDLVLEDLQLALFVLKFLCVDIDLTL